MLDCCKEKKSLTELMEALSASSRRTFVRQIVNQSIYGGEPYRTDTSRKSSPPEAEVSVDGEGRCMAEKARRGR